MDIFNLCGWFCFCGYFNGIKCNGEMIFIVGQIGWDEIEIIVFDDFVE